MTFHNIQFPSEISYGSSGGPMFSTTIMALNSGHERRNINWSTVRASYQASHGIKTRAQMEELINFFYSRWGRAHSFRYKDWMDFQTGAQSLLAGDGTETEFQILKTYTSGGYNYSREITKPITSTLLNVAVNAVVLVEGAGAGKYQVDYDTGIITFGTPPGAAETVTIGSCDFDVHVRFDMDQINIIQEFWETMTWPSIPIVEIKEDSDG